MVPSLYIEFCTKIVELFDTHIVSLGMYTAGTKLNKNPAKKNVRGRLYATIPHLDDDIRSALEDLFDTTDVWYQIWLHSTEQLQSTESLF